MDAKSGRPHWRPMSLLDEKMVRSARDQVVRLATSQTLWRAPSKGLSTLEGVCTAGLWSTHIDLDAPNISIRGPLPHVSAASRTPF